MIKITKDTPLKMIRELSKDCTMCGNCCKYGAGFLVPEDIPRLARFLGMTEQELKEKCLEEIEIFNTKAWKPKRLKEGKPYGKCMFFAGENGCSVHAAKPFQCAITNCSEFAEHLIQWLYLNYFVNPDDPESVRQWASYLKGKEWVIQGGNLHELVPDQERLRKIMSYEALK